jgi:outer membrane protein TolC
MKHCIPWMVLLLAGCASYEPAPLASETDLVRRVETLSVDASAMPTAGLRTHRFDPSDGLDATELAMLAVAANPDLKAARADLGVTRAQAFAAGQLPDPQLAIGGERMLHPVPGATTAFSLGLTIDVAAILARSSARAAADGQTRQAVLSLLWQEWQVVAQARLAFAKLRALDDTRALLAQREAALRPQVAHARDALARGLVTSDAVAPLLAALADVDRQRSDALRLDNQARHDLNALVGVAPDVVLPLVGDAEVATITEAQAAAALAQAPRRRPDLLALQAGFESQDARYRGALAAQFPTLTVGPTRARDTSNVNTQGLALGLSLPLFNRNRGNIAIERATREKLRVDWQQRLDAAASDTDRLLRERALAQRQLAEAEAAAADLRRVADHAETAFAAHALDALALTNAEQAWLAKALEAVAARQSLQEQAIALQALLGGEFDTPSPSPDHP